MPALPRGTVTFLFTDIEGSTRLWDAYPQAMRLSLARHDALLRTAITQYDGHVFKTIGDAFCAAFHTAPDALNAALAAQQALYAEVWPEALLLRVRMALHTGAPELRDNDYFGPPLNRVARLLSAGHGGQILLSDVASDLCADTLPDEATLHNLGTHSLRDLGRPETVFQLLHPALPSDFPPLKTLHSFPNNLPQQLTSFIGREKEMAEGKALLEKTRLLTLTGAGGSGKTRLSLQLGADVLEQFPDGVWLVELAALTDPALVLPEVASVLSIKEQSGRALQPTLLDNLKSKQLLLLLDNCEHLLTACAQLVSALLRACPEVHVIATSRERLGIGGELTYRVPSLSSPDGKQPATPESLSQYEAVRLFIARAQFHKPEFVVTNQNAPALAQLCANLDGIPLAIELAAARIRSLPVEEINTRLDNRFRLLTGGDRAALPRQQTLRALMDWSYDLLNPQEKALLQRLSVFAGGWSLTAVEQIASGETIEDWEVLDLLGSLVDKSLVLAEERPASARYRMLETVRQYARDRLVESQESVPVRRRHRDYFLSLAEEIRPKLNASEQVQWLEVLEEEHDNLRQALTFCLEEAEGGEAGLRLGAAVQRFWSTHGHLSEGRECLVAFLSHPGAQERTATRADALNGAGTLINMQGDRTYARTLFQECLEIQRELADQGGIAASFSNLGMVAKAQGDYVAARTLQEESLAIRRELGNRHGIAICLSELGAMAGEQGDYASARSLLEESLAIRRELRDSLGISICLGELGIMAAARSDYASARTLMEESLTLMRELGDKSNIAVCLGNLANITHFQGDYAAARSLMEEGLTIMRELKDKQGIAYSLGNLGNITMGLSDYAAARPLFEESLTITREMGDKRGIAGNLHNMGLVAQGEESYASARSFLEESLAMRRELGDKRGIANSLNELGMVAAALGDDASAHSLCEEGLEIRRELGDRRGIVLSLSAFAALAARKAKEERAARLWGAAEALRETIGLVLTPREQENIERDAGIVRETLGETAFAAAAEEGRAMTMEQAMDNARDED